MFSVKGILETVVSPISKAYQSGQERKKAADSAKAKIALAKQNNDYNLKLNDAEWESLSKKSENETWKDEYVTVIVTSPFVLLFMASIISGWTGDMRYLNAVNLGITNIKNLDVDLGELMYLVVVAAVSIKGYGILRNK